MPVTHWRFIIVWVASYPTHTLVKLNLTRIFLYHYYFKKSLEPILDESKFTEYELEVIKNPELHLNKFLQSYSEVENMELTKMYGFAKDYFKGVIPMQDIKEIVDIKFRDSSQVRIQSKTGKITLLVKAIKKGKSKIASKEEQLRNLMNEPFSLVANSEVED